MQSKGFFVGDVKKGVDPLIVRVFCSKKEGKLFLGGKDFCAIILKVVFGDDDDEFQHERTRSTET